MWERAAGVVPSLCLSWPANLARSASRSGPRLASLAKPSRPQVGLHRTSKDGTYNLWLALATYAWVSSCTNDHSQSLIVYACLLQLMRGLCPIKTALLQLCGVYTGALATHAWLMWCTNVPPQRHGRMANGAKKDPVARVAAVATT